MRQSTLALVCGVALVIILAYSWCGRNPPQQSTLVAPTPEPTAAPPSATPNATTSVAASASATQTPTPAPIVLPPEFEKVVHKADPAVVELTVFDAKGQLLRSGNAFFVSRDGLLITGLPIVADGAYGVAKTSDGRIRNITGVITSSTESGLALLRAETKIGVSFLPLAKTSESVAVGALTVVVGSSLQHKEQPLAAGKISSRGQDPMKDAFEIGGSIPNDATGAPVLDDKGEVVGIVTAGGKNAVEPTGLLDPLLAQAKPGANGRWAAAPVESPTPTLMPHVARRVTFDPAPRYPPEARSIRFGPNRGSGKYRVTFDLNGVVQSVQTVQSTGQPILDQAAIAGLRQWRAEPGSTEWTVMVPVTFQP
jgi:TonB family protein